MFLQSGSVWIGNNLFLDVGDVEGDGDPDIVSISNRYLSVMRNDGQGHLTTDGHQPSIGPEVLSKHIVLADIDLDGALDAIVTDEAGDRVGVMRGDGLGAFADAIWHGVGDEPRCTQAGDLDGDGDLDLVCINPKGRDASILINLGHGEFAPERRVAVGSMSRQFTGDSPGPFHDIVDVDGDGDLDLVIPTFREVVILLNDGSGSFENALTTPRSPETHLFGLRAADLDGDGDPDIACSIAQFGGRSLVAVYLNEGGGTFGEVTIYDSTFGYGAIWFNTNVDLADLDRDGDLDLVMGRWEFDRAVVHRNHGDGTFADAELLPMGTGPVAVAIADMNGDGWPDLVGGDNDRIVRVRLNDGRGGLPQSEHALLGDLDPSRGADSLTTADFDLDGDLDLFAGEITCSTTEIYALWRNDGSGRFALDGGFAAGALCEWMAGPVLAVDLNGDGRAEIVAGPRRRETDAAELPSDMLVLDVSADEIREVCRFTLADMGVTRFVAGDFDSDGDLDIAAHGYALFDPNDLERVVERLVLIFRNDGDACLTLAQRLVIDELQTNYLHGGLDAADFDGDGDLDLAATVGTLALPTGLTLLENNGSGIFGIGSEQTLPSYGLGLKAVDANRDALPDLAVMFARPYGEPEDAHLRTYTNLGGLTFTHDQQFHLPGVEPVDHPVVVDLNRDGLHDIVISMGFSTCAVHLGRGEGGFDAARSYALSDRFWPLAAEDFDGDDLTDLLALGPNGSEQPIMILRNRLGHCRGDFTGSSNPGDVTYGEPDGDIDFDDFMFFIELFAFGSLRADVSGSDDSWNEAYGVPDGRVDAADFFTFLDWLAAGCG